MFFVIPLVEFLRMLGVDINVHHENSATFLRHVSVSSVKRNRYRFAASRWHPVLTPGAQEYCLARSSVSSRHTATKFGRNQHRPPSIVRDTHLAGLCNAMLPGLE